MSAATLVTVLDGLDEAPAIRVTEGGPAASRAALRADIWAVATKLAQAGVKRGDVVSICLKNNIENAISFLAATWLGAIAAPLNPTYTNDEFAYELRNISSKFVVVPAAGHAKVEEVAAAQGVAVLTIQTKGPGCTTTLEPRARCTLAPSAELSKAEPADTALFLHTSGTTGKPKGVPCSHTNMLATLRNVSSTYKLGPADRGYLVMPLFHVHGIMASLLSAFYAASEVILPARDQGFQAESFWRDVAEHKATWYTAVPTMHQTLLKGLDKFAAAGKPQLRFIRSCSASLPPSVLHELEGQFHAPVLEAYAMTEASHQIASNPLPELGPHKPGSVGQGTNVEVIVVAAAGGEAQVAQGEVGEVCVRGPNVTIGYHNRPDANKEAFMSTGFFRTGDLGYLDPEGYIYLTGRIKEQVNRGGEKIAPIAIDNVLLRCPAVSALFCFGAPHEDLGEAVAAIVVVNKGEKLSLAQLNRFGLDSGELSLQWLPEVIVYADAVPKGPTGKVQRVKLASVLGLPKLTQADAGASFRLTSAGKLERLSEEGAGGEAEVSLASIEAAVGSILGLDVSGMGDKKLVIDSFSATRLAATLRKRFQVDVKAKNLINGVTLPQILALVQNGERVAAPGGDAEEVNMASIEAAVGSILGLDLSGVGDRPLTLDSFTATRLAATLRKRFQVDVKPKSLVNGVTLPQILALVQTGESVGAAKSLDWEAEAAVPGPLAGALAWPAKDTPMEASDVVLLTGATGFLGAHLLAALLRGPHRVLCVARAASNKEARARVESTLRGQGEWSAEFDARVQCVTGDVSLPNFGLADLGIQLLSQVRFIIHNAAAVNHASEYADLKLHNVGSAVHALSLAQELQARSGRVSRVAYISTAGVCGRRACTDEPSAPRVPLADLDSQNGYVQSKWVAERMLENANEIVAKAGGRSRFSIFRPGAISGHSETGICNLGDSLNRYVIGFSLLGSAPPLKDMTAQVDMSPVDWVARTIVGCALQDAADQTVTGTPTYTLDNGLSLPYSTLVDLLRLPVAANYDDWLKRLQAALDMESKDKTMFATPLRDLLGALRMRPPVFGSTGSTAHMKMLETRGFGSPRITPELLQVYLNRFVREKVLPSLPGEQSRL